MSDPTAFVYVDLEATPRLVGRLWSHTRGRRESATFRYADDWLTFEHRFALEPALALGPGAHHTAEGRKVFGALGDSAPDRWGRNLLRRNERRAAEEQGRAVRTLREVDFLLGVTDEIRQGALRFSLEEGGPFVARADEEEIPPVVELPTLLAAAQSILDDRETAAELNLLLGPGSSLGGARPKASVRDTDGSLKMAKFPATADKYDEVRWEAVALSLAAHAGIETPEWDLLDDINGKPVLLLDRFDRRDDARRPFLSAMSMLGASDGDTRSYAEIADALRRHGAEAGTDCRSLWRRLVFNILVSNTDDHLRNHGFLYEGLRGWRLSPAYDLVPVPVDIAPRALSTTVDYEGDPTASLELALERAAYFGLGEDEARAVARDVGEAVSAWATVAEDMDVADTEVERMASAFEHEDLARARAA